MKAFPNLNTGGFLTTPTQILDEVFANYITSDHYQSNVYGGNVRDLKHTLSKFNNNPQQLKEAITDDIRALYQSIFDDVTPDVRIVLNEQDPNLYRVQADVTVFTAGVPYKLSKVLDIENSQIKRAYESEKYTA